MDIFRPTKFDKIFLRIVIYGMIISAYINYPAQKKKQHNDKIYSQIERELDSELNEELFQNYEEYIELVAKEIKNVNFNNTPLEVFSTYLYLQQNGLISYGNFFEYEKCFIEFPFEYGVNVVTGKGVCRNQTNNLINVLNNLGYDAKIVCGELHHRNGATGVTNHCVCYINYNGIDLYLDPTNNTMFMYDGENLVSIYESDMLFSLDKEYDAYKGYYPDNKKAYSPKKITSEEYDQIINELIRVEYKLEEYLLYFADYENEYLYNVEEYINNYLENKEETKKKLLGELK